MNRSFLKGAAVGVVCALLGGATVALAGSGVGGVFNLGVSNSVDPKTALTGAYVETQLEVTNTGGANGVQGVSNRRRRRWRLRREQRRRLRGRRHVVESGRRRRLRLRPSHRSLWPVGRPERLRRLRQRHRQRRRRRQRHGAWRRRRARRRGALKRHRRSDGCEQHRQRPRTGPALQRCPNHRRLVGQGQQPQRRQGRRARLDPARDWRARTRRRPPDRRAPNRGRPRRLRC